MKNSAGAFSVIPPYGGTLVDLVVCGAEREELLEKANRLPALRLSPRAVCDLELLATGAFSPLDRFMGKADYEEVLHRMRLADGTLFPIPIALPAPEVQGIKLGQEIALRSPRNELLAVMLIEELYEWDASVEAGQVCGVRRNLRK